MSDAGDRIYRFGPYCLDTRRRELRDGGALLPLTAKAFDTLQLLVEQRDRVVGKDELMATVWAGRVVEENNLSQAIAALRRAFGSGADDHQYIVTVHGRGYRFVAQVHAAAEEAGLADAAVLPVAEAPEPLAMPAGTAALASELVRDRRRRAKPHRGLVLSALIALLVAASFWRLPAPGRAVGAADVSSPVTLAVLPFRPISGGTRDELLELGLAETLVTRLGRSPALRVRAMGSTRSLGSKDTDAIAIGRELSASYVVAGTTQHVGGAVRINVQLWSVDGGDALWTQTFDEDIDRIFTLQDRIGDAIVMALALQHVARQGGEASPCEGGDTIGYRAMLRAQYQLHRRGVETLDLYREAIDRDPTCSRAYAGMAFAYMFEAHNDGRPGDVFPLARAAALQALRLDPQSVDGLVAYGRYLQLHEWDWDGAEAALRTAIARNPSHVEARYGLAHLLVSTGRFDEGLGEIRQARELDPLSPLVNALEGGFLSAAGQPDAALESLEHALELEPDFWIALKVRGGLALDRQDPEAAVADLRRAAQRTQRTSQVLAVLAAAEVAAGRRAEAEAILQELQARAAHTYVPAINLAAVHNALGDTAAALDALEQAYAAHDIRVAFLKVDARWNNLRGEPRFQALMQQLALPEAVASGRY